MSGRVNKDELVDGLLRRLAGIGPVEAAELLVTLRATQRQELLDATARLQEVIREALESGPPSLQGQLSALLPSPS
mgnify:CR=1 FL=1